MWVIKEGINFVQGFDHVHMAMTMTVRSKEAKRFRTKREAELWVDQYGKDLESFRILDDQVRNVQHVWFPWRNKHRDARYLEGS